MKRILLFSFFVIGICQLQAQIIYLLTTNEKICRLDILTCDYEEVVIIDRPLTDISFHPDGTLYGISSGGQLVEIDTITGSTVTVFNFAGNGYNSLTAAANGILYITGANGILYTYNNTTDQGIALGPYGYGATGDLTFYKGNLYVAVDGDRIVLIDLNNLSNSKVVINESIAGEIFGIVSFSESCDSINCYAVSSGFSDIYLIDFVTKTLDPVCHLDIRVGGGASTYEFYGSAPLIFDTVTTIQPSCNLMNGSITISVSGGIAPLSYSINGIDYQPENTFGGLSAGHYQIIISDANGCNIIEEAFLSPMDGPKIDTLSAIPTTCGAQNGMINIVASGGVGNIQYSLDHSVFQSSSSFNQLGPGMHLITIQDAAGCKEEDSIEVAISLPAAITAIHATSPLCDELTGYIEVDANGINPVQYSLDGINYQAENRFDDLLPANYLIMIEDANGCKDTSGASIDPAVPLLITEVDIESPLCGDNAGSIAITSNGGMGSIQFSIDGFNFQDSNSFDSLAPATYLVTIRDENNCIDATSAIIDSGETILISNIESIAPTCEGNDGSLMVTVEGSIGGIEYSIDGIQFQSSPIFLNLSSGNYQVNVVDELGCSTTGTAMLDEPHAFQVNNILLNPSDCIVNNGSITVQVLGATGQVIMALNNGLFQSANSFQNLSSGDYLVTIEDEIGCRIDTSIHLGQLRCQIYIPNMFSPNGDGFNDLFNLSTTSDYKVNVVKYMIFDRWGNKVYSANDFPIDSPEHWWDGTFKKMSMSPGVFAYYIEVEYEDGVSEIFKGDVTLVR